MLTDKERKRILELIFLIGIIVLGDLVTGAIGIASPVSTTAIAGCNNPRTLVQCGTASCTIILEPTICSVTITFSPAFTANPKFTTATWIGFNGASNHPEKEVPYATVYFQSDAGETWVNMPAAETEVYGTTVHETLEETGQVLGLATIGSFQVTCIQSSNSATAFLRPEYFNPNLGTWHQLAQNAGFMDIDISSNQACGPAGFGTVPLFSQSSTFDSAYMPGDFLRVAGFNGGGIGDSVTLNNMYLSLFAQIKQTPSICVANVASTGSGCPVGIFPANPKTQMIIFATIAYPPLSGFEVDVNWMASE